MLALNSRLHSGITCFSLWTSYYFIIESVDAFYFVNNVVVYKALLAKEKGGKVVYKIFIVNVVSKHLSVTWQFWPFQRPWTGISWGGLMRPEVGGGVQKCEDTMSSKKFSQGVSSKFNAILLYYNYHPPSWLSFCKGLGFV